MFRRALIAATLTIPLTLGAVAPVAAAPAIKLRMTVSPSSINVGSLAVGEDSSRVVLYVTNASKVPLRFRGSTFNFYGLEALTVDAALTAPCWDGTETVVQPGETCGLYTVFFRPQTTGQVAAVAEFRFSDGVTPVVLTVIAKARGV